jgi:hypothetical protein
MKDLVAKLETVVANHFDGFQVTIDTDRNDEFMYKLRLSRRMEVTGITIFPRVINRVIKSNFTIFERMFHGEKIQNTAIMVLSSTIYNLVHYKAVLETLVDRYNSSISTEMDYQKVKADLEILLGKLANHIIPFKDRNKYLIQPDIRVNLKSKLPEIFSNIELVSYMNQIGYRPETNKRGKVLPWLQK